MQGKHFLAGLVRMSVGWVVLFSKRAREFYARENLMRLGVQVYLPILREVVPKGRSKKPQERKAPVFPRYMFCHIEHRWYFLLSVFGVQGIVMQGESPAFVRPQVLEDLQRREDAQGYIVPSPFRPGDPVRIISGPFNGQFGIHAGMHGRDRQKVLLQILGQEAPVFIDTGRLQAAA